MCLKSLLSSSPFFFAYSSTRQLRYLLLSCVSLLPPHAFHTQHTYRYNTHARPAMVSAFARSFMIHQTNSKSISRLCYTRILVFSPSSSNRHPLTFFMSPFYLILSILSSHFAIISIAGGGILHRTLLRTIQFSSGKMSIRCLLLFCTLFAPDLRWLINLFKNHITIGMVLRALFWPTV